ncbi:unnamed protein product, partial [Darwinula stevensoni]
MVCSQVSTIILHEDFNIRNYDSTIALVRLTEPAILTDRVQIVCLPTGFDLSQQNLENGKQGWVAGWGYDESDILSEELTEVEIPVLSNHKCILDTIHFIGDPSPARTLTSNMFCAGYVLETSFEDYKTVCRGDSGSPMVFFSARRWHVEGIVSHSLFDQPCSMRRPGQYTIFTKVN